jgi:hypothetical protein
VQVLAVAEREPGARSALREERGLVRIRGSHG